MWSANICFENSEIMRTIKEVMKSARKPRPVSTTVKWTKWLPWEGRRSVGRSLTLLVCLQQALVDWACTRSSQPAKQVSGQTADRLALKETVPADTQYNASGTVRSAASLERAAASASSSPRKLQLAAPSKVRVQLRDIIGGGCMQRATHLGRQINFFGSITVLGKETPLCSASQPSGELRLARLPL